MEAAVILMKCIKGNQMYGVRTQKMEDGDWWRTWSFPVDEKRARNEGYDVTRVIGNMKPTKEFRGCPYCGSKGFVQCNQCNNLVCWNGETEIVCPWCDNFMDNFIEATEKFSVSGGDI